MPGDHEPEGRSIFVSINPHPAVTHRLRGCEAGSPTTRAPLRKEIREGRIVAKRIGRCVRILDEDLSRWMRD